MKYTDLILGAIQGHTPSEPQSLAGILADLGPSRRPNLAELEYGIRSLIRDGLIAEAAPHQYYEVFRRLPRPTFSEVSSEEYAKACQEACTALPGWNTEALSLPSAYLYPSPGRTAAAALCDVQEVRMSWYLGWLALLKGPPEKPELLLALPHFCCTCDSERCIQWLGNSRYCVVEPAIPAIYNLGARAGTVWNYTIFDLVDRTFAVSDLSWWKSGGRFFQDGGQWVFTSESAPGACKEAVIVPGELEWRPWHLLSDSDDVQRGTSSAPNHRVNLM